MKKIILMCLIMVSAISGVTNAEIRKNADSSGIIISSTFEKCDPYYSEILSFNKYIVGGEIFYRLVLRTEATYSDWLLKDKVLSISLGKYPEFYIKDYHYESDTHWATIEFTIKEDMINRIRKSDHGNIRFESFLKENFIGLSPLLPEWKEVINTVE